VTPARAARRRRYLGGGDALAKDAQTLVGVTELRRDDGLERDGSGLTPPSRKKRCGRSIERRVVHVRQCVTPMRRGSGLHPATLAGHQATIEASGR
jgi:hypothetical protein